MLMFDGAFAYADTFIYSSHRMSVDLLRQRTEIKRQGLPAITAYDNLHLFDLAQVCQRLVVIIAITAGQKLAVAASPLTPWLGVYVMFARIFRHHLWPFVN
jgi:hypothetical protein